MLIEYKVRPVTRYIVTRYEETDNAGGSSFLGEFDRYETAYAVGYALCKDHHERLCFPIDDPRIKYPEANLEEVSRAMSIAKPGDTFA